MKEEINPLGQNSEETIKDTTIYRLEKPVPGGIEGTEFGASPEHQEKPFLTEEYRDELVEEYSFQVPYDGSDKFYNEDKAKHFNDGYDAAAKKANARISSLESAYKIELKANETLRTEYQKLQGELKALREERDELFDGDKKNLINLDNEQEAKSKLLKRSLEWMCLPSNEQLLKDRAEIIKEGQSFFKLIDKDKY